MSAADPRFPLDALTDDKTSEILDRVKDVLDLEFSLDNTCESSGAYILIAPISLFDVRIIGKIPGVSTVAFLRKCADDLDKPPIGPSW